MSNLPIMVCGGHVFRVQTTVCFLLTGACVGFAGAAVPGEEHGQQKDTFPVVLARSQRTPSCFTLLPWVLEEGPLVGSQPRS